MFAVAVRLLMLLGCLPLLHPPGVCAAEWVAAHHDHDHGDCPRASADTERPRPADPTPDPAAVSEPLVAVAVVAPPVAAVSPIRLSAAWPSAPPLYLSHCALVC